MYTASSVFLRTLSEYGITHVFVNWGNDHPAMLEELERQRILNGSTALEIVTSPNEMVALSAAQGYAQVTGKPAAVIVHVDVGTQGMAGAVHNVDRCRTPVLIYAGASPFTTSGELGGSRCDFAMTLQDIPDQAAIVRQYMRHTAQINSAKYVPQTVLRGLQLATSDPKGPAYLWARREIMEEEVDETIMNGPINLEHWKATEPAALADSAVKQIVDTLSRASNPLIITSYLGRNHRAVGKLVEFSERLAVPVYQCCPTNVNFPFNHPNAIDLTMGLKEDKCVREADVILIIDSDIPYIPVYNKPRPDAIIFHIDVDILKRTIGMFHVDAVLRCQADSGVALGQLIEELKSKQDLDSNTINSRSRKLAESHAGRIRRLNIAELSFPADGSFTVPNIISALRKNSPKRSLVLNEAITNFYEAWNHMRCDTPGSMASAGATSIGWGLGAAIGACIGGRSTGMAFDLITLVVGDGSFLFGIPGAAFWMARKYNTPFLTIILNNGGWKSPKASMLAVHPDGYGSKASGDKLTVGFGPTGPDYAQIAVAAGGAWGRRVSEAAELEGAIQEAVRTVTKEGRCAVLDCLIESF